MAGLIPESIINEILARTDIVELVSSYVPLDKKSSANLFGLCPFHEEDTPSFSVAPRKQIFYCFGCHKGGNAIKFIQEIEHLSFPEAIRLLAKRVNVDIPETDDPHMQEMLKLRKRLLAIMLDAARFYHLTLLDEEGLKARSYLKGRAIKKGIAQKFGLGYAPAAWDKLCQHLQSKGYSQDELLKAGLATRTRQNTLIDFFRNRVMFPVFDRQGNLLAFGGRALEDSGPKYLNTNDTVIYHKGKHLYGLNFSKKSKSDKIILVEGYFDVISLYLAGIDYAVATLGTALTSSQANLLKQQTNNVITCFDADRSGRKATLKSARMLEKIGINVEVLLVPENKDPDDYIREYGPNRFLALLNETMEPLAFELEMIRQDSLSEDGSLQISAYQNLAAGLLAKEENAILREIYAAKVAEEIGTTTKAVLTEIARRQNSPQDDQSGNLTGDIPPRSRLRSTPSESVKADEIQLILLISEYNDILPELDFTIESEDFEEGPLRKIAERMLNPEQTGIFTTANLPTIVEEISGGDEVLMRPIMEASINSSELSNPSQRKEAIRRLFHKLRSERFVREAHDLLEKATNSNDPKLKSEYLEKYKNKQFEGIRWKQNIY
ncbi:MAG TPA: DNA primase [Clostridiaceae bacterium]|nr:DNA primase [Clostridiaceae bacterium]